MEVYLVEQKNMTRIPESDLDTEANLEQRLVRTDGATIGGVDILYVGRQGSPGDGGIFDILGVDEHGDAVIVELKRDRAPRDIVAQALEYASEIRNVDYTYLADQYRQFLREEQGYDEPADLSPLIEAHAEYFGLDEPLSKREFNTDQRLVVVGTDFRDVSLNMADFLRDHGIDVICVEYSSYAEQEGSVELLVTDSIRRPLSEEPAARSQDTDEIDYSRIIEPIQDIAYSQIKDIVGAEEPNDVLGGTSGRSLIIRSNNPDHPDNLNYKFKPRFEEEAWGREDATCIRISVRGGDDETKEHIQSSLSALEPELEDNGFEFHGDSWLGVVQKYFQNDITVEEADQEYVERMANEIVTLIEIVHPKLTEGKEVHE